jgi:hypothetical protein
MSIHPEGKSDSDLGRVLVLNDPLAWMQAIALKTKQLGKEHEKPVQHSQQQPLTAAQRALQIPQRHQVRVQEGDAAADAISAEQARNARIMQRTQQQAGTDV